MLRSVAWQSVHGQSGGNALDFALKITKLYGVTTLDGPVPHSTNAMFGIEIPKGRAPLQGASIDVTSPRAKAPGLFC
jgi:hypothetical protein